MAAPSRTWPPTFLLPVLAPLSLLYRIGLALRRLGYALFPGRVRKGEIPVICIGNLTVGGTGKTPAVAWLARELRKMGRRPAIVSRGYRAPRADQVNEEGKMLAAELPDVPHVQDPNRFRGVRAAAREHNADVAILDDGFQHWRLAREVDVVLVDATDPFGGGHLLPWGKLREPISGLKRADAVILTRTALVDTERRREIEEEVRRHLGEKPILKGIHKPRELAALAGGHDLPVEWLTEKRVLLVTGVGNPGAVEKTVARHRGIVAGHRIYPDHYFYTDEDVERILGAAEDLEVKGIVTTSKDGVKLRELLAGHRHNLPWYELKIRFEPVGSAESLFALIRERIGG